MKTINIKNLYKFQLLPFDTEFFNRIYRLTGRSGKLGAIDQILETYPNCILGLHAYGYEDGVFYFIIYLLYYQINDGKVTYRDILENNFSVQGDGFFKGHDTATMFIDSDNPELYFLDNLLPEVLSECENKIIEEQRLFFNENLEEIETAALNIEEPFFDNPATMLDFINLNEPLTQEMLLKLESIRQ